MTTDRGPSFPAGAVIIVDPDTTPEPGKFVVVSRGGSPIFRRLEVQDGRPYLVPLNRQYPADPMNQDDAIVGVVVRVQFDV